MNPCRCLKRWRETERRTMKKLYYVHTHVGTFETWATSAKKALANVRWRVYGGRCDAKTKYWEAVEA